MENFRPPLTELNAINEAIKSGAVSKFLFIGLSSYTDPEGRPKTTFMTVDAPLLSLAERCVMMDLLNEIQSDKIKQLIPRPKAEQGTNGVQ